MNDQRTPWTNANTSSRTDDPDPWIEPKLSVQGVVLLPHGPLPVCDSWWMQLPGSVRTRPHAASTSESLGAVSVPMS
jgi:hypothetical protein